MPLTVCVYFTLFIQVFFHVSFSQVDNYLTNKVTYNVYILRTLVVSTLGLSRGLFSSGVALQYADIYFQCPLVVFNEDIWLFSLVQGLSSHCRDMVSNLSVGEALMSPQNQSRILNYYCILVISAHSALCLCALFLSGSNLIRNWHCLC